MTEAQLLDGQAFNRLVLENDLAGKTWEEDGYIYAGLKGKDGWELYRTYGPKWTFLWIYKQVCTQDNVAGGTLAVSVRPAVGQVARIEEVVITASGNRAIAMNCTDGTVDWMRMVSIGATAACTGGIPNIGTAASSSAHMRNSQGTFLTNLKYLWAQVTSAAQTETATIKISMFLSSNTAPTVSWAGSGGTPNAAAATMNTIVPVLMPCPS